MRVLLLESKQSIVNLGYPLVVASLFYKRFGEKAYLFARWYKEYKNIGENDKYRLADLPYGGGISGIHYVNIYNAARAGDGDAYLKSLENAEVSTSDYLSHKDDPEYLKHMAKLWLDKYNSYYFESSFFKDNRFISDIINGKIDDLKKYDHLKYEDAERLYDEHILFSKKRAVKTYSNGYRWISMGAKCTLVGNRMRNCGSTGVMSDDKRRVGMVLFDSHNNPHVIVTYSPTQKRISGDEGVASTAVKPEYHKYILDLVHRLRAKFDIRLTKSIFLKLRYIFGINNVTQVNFKKKTGFNEYFKIKHDNHIYYSNGYEMIEQKSAKTALDKIKINGVKLYRGRGRNRLGLMDILFNDHNTYDLKANGAEYKYVQKYVTDQS